MSLILCAHAFETSLLIKLNIVHFNVLTNINLVIGYMYQFQQPTLLCGQSLALSDTFSTIENLWLTATCLIQPLLHTFKHKSTVHLSYCLDLNDQHLEDCYCKVQCVGHVKYMGRPDPSTKLTLVRLNAALLVWHIHLGAKVEDSMRLCSQYGDIWLAHCFQACLVRTLKFLIPDRSICDNNVFATTYQSS
jgi:hypothetical protein